MGGTDPGMREKKRMQPEWRKKMESCMVYAPNMQKGGIDNAQGSKNKRRGVKKRQTNPRN